MTDEKLKKAKEYKYICFEQTGYNGKTYTWSCQNKSSGGELGIVKWYSAWRQYCFFTEVGAVYSAGCLDDISDFIKSLMEKRKREKIREEHMTEADYQTWDRL